MNLPSDGVLVETVTVGPEWLDRYGEPVAARYLRAFDDAGDRLTALAGMGEAYTRRTGRSWVALESHLSFAGRALPGERVRIESRVIEVLGKKLHVCQAMVRDGSVLATHEQLGLHFDTTTRRSCPFEPAVLATLNTLCERQRRLPRPAWIGRAVALAAEPAR